MTTAVIQKWGNSQGVRIPKHLLDAVKLAESDKIVIRAESDKLIIEKAIPTVNRKTIKELFEGYNGKYDPQEIDWGEQTGGEAW